MSIGDCAMPSAHTAKLLSSFAQLAGPVFPAYDQRDSAAWESPADTLTTIDSAIPNVRCTVGCDIDPVLRKDGRFERAPDRERSGVSVPRPLAGVRHRPRL